jgi:flagellar biosynthetic protein FliQ
MNAQTVVEVLRQTMWMAFWVGLPLLAIGLAAGILISLLQILTSMQDAAVGAVPRLVAFLAAFLLFLPWMLSRLVGFTSTLLGDLSRYAR